MGTGAEHGDSGAETVVHGDWCRAWGQWCRDCGAEHGDSGAETGVSTSPSIACIPLLIPYTSEPQGGNSWGAVGALAPPTFCQK